MSALECRVIPEREILPVSHPVYELERQAIYPLGRDRFRIDHGSDYLCFFRRLGSLTYLSFYRDGRIAGVIALVLRQVPRGENASPERVAYVCDVKVASEFRGSSVVFEMLAEAVRRLVPISDRFYGVSMNSPGEKPGSVENRVVGMFHRRMGSSAGPELSLYSVSTEALPGVLPTVERFCGRVGALSLAGIKDLILESTGARMPLIHLQYGPCAEKESREKPTAAASESHMFAAPTGSKLWQALHSAGHQPVASATVFQRNMLDWDWGFILTSDI